MQICAALKFSFITHGFDHIDQLYGFDIEYTLGQVMVTKHLMITGKAQHIPYAVGIGP